VRLVALILLVGLMSLCECALEASAADAPPPAPASSASGAWESVRGTARRVWDFELLEVGEHTLSVHPGGRRLRVADEPGGHADPEGR
jgi:hypothetical protein